MIEDKIDALIAALNANTAALLGRAPTTTTETPKADKTSKPRDDFEEKHGRKMHQKPPEKPAEVVTSSAVVTPSAAASELSVEAFQAVGHAIINARHAKNLEPANAPIKALANEYQVKKISEVAGTPEAAEVMTKLQAILKEVQS